MTKDSKPLQQRPGDDYNTAKVSHSYIDTSISWYMYTVPRFWRIRC